MVDPAEGLSSSGAIVTGVRRDRVPAPFEGVVISAIEQFEADAATNPPASLHLYGSVATGEARATHSDVDLLTVGLPEQAAHELSERLTDQFDSLCRSVDVAPMSSSCLAAQSDEGYGNRVFLRHYCVPLAGPDPVDRSYDFLGDRHAARGFNGDLARHVDRWLSELAAGADPAVLARIAARKSLLAVAGLVSIHDHTWTTDRFRAARRWSSIDPGVASGLETLLAWTEDGSGATREQLDDAIDGPIRQIVMAFERDIGLWP